MGSPLSTDAAFPGTMPGEDAGNCMEEPPADDSSTTQTSKTRSWWQWFVSLNREDGTVANPGGYDELNQDATVILRPNVIEGLSFNFNAPVSDSFMLGSGIDLGAKDCSGTFALTANYFTNRLVMLSRTTPTNGRINGRIFINHCPSFTTKAVADVGIEPDSSRVSCDFDYRAARSSSQIKLATGRVIAFNHLHSLSPNFAIGAEALVQARSGFCAMTFALKHDNSSHTTSLSLATFGPLVASYVRKVNKKVSFATEFFMDMRTKESHVTLGYRFDLLTATVVGHVDSVGRVAATLEERVNPALALSLSAELDHTRENHRFGFGISIGSN